MERIINFVNLIGWTYILVQTQIQVVFNTQNYLTSDISLSVTILRAVQLLQILDLVLLLLGKAKGNFLAGFFQILGRNFVTLLVIEEDMHRLVYAGVVIVWSIAEVNRYLFYLYKSSSITAFLRYNGFLILYPLGAVAQTLVFNDYFKRHPDISSYHHYFFRFANGCIIIGVAILYKYMLGGRKRYMKAKQAENAQNKEVKGE